MVADVIINEGGNKIVRVIVTRLKSQEQRHIEIPACLFELVRKQLILQKLVIFPLKEPKKIHESKARGCMLTNHIM